MPKPELKPLWVTRKTLGPGVQELPKSPAAAKSSKLFDRSDDWLYASENARREEKRRLAEAAVTRKWPEHSTEDEAEDQVETTTTGGVMEDKGIKGTQIDDKVLAEIRRAKNKFAALAALPAFLLGVGCGAGLVWWLG